jgi:hypothetical protein
VESLAADASRGPELQSLLNAEARSVAERLLSDEFEPGTAFTPDELMRRVESYEALTAPLGRAWGNLGWWTPPASARGAIGLIGYLAALRDRGSGIRPWLDLYAYPRCCSSTRSGCVIDSPGTCVVLCGRRGGRGIGRGHRRRAGR